MTTGTKSLLFGVHQIVLHPLTVLVCWVRLYGLPGLPELIAIVIHDWGYWGCPHMDDVTGEAHPGRSARIAYRWALKLTRRLRVADRIAAEIEGHSRHYARKIGRSPSRLMAADKLGSALYPPWLYLVLGRASGELAEYRDEADRYFWETGQGVPLSASDREWHRWICKYLRSVAVVPTDGLGSLRAAWRERANVREERRNPLTTVPLQKGTVRPFSERQEKGGPSLGGPPQ